MKWVPRAMADVLRRRLASFPAVLLVGPRQCGKSALARDLLPAWRHLDLERPADVGLLAADLEGFFAAQPRHVVIDEAQRFPDLFPALRSVIDRGKGMGRFLLLGSASPRLMRSVSESLAGRLGILELTPFLASELSDRAHVKDRWFWGGFPPIHARRSVEKRVSWLESYVSTFLERDLPALGPRLSPQRLRNLWTMLTHVHGNLLNVSDLARSLGVSHHTVADHLDVLEGAFLIRRLPPYFANIQKRLTKSPKLYVRDTGLLHHLAGLRRPSDLETWPRRGSSFEGLVVEELISLARQRLVAPEFFFWRTQAGGEVDLLIADGRRILPIEVKSAAAIDPRSLAGLRECMSDLGLDRGWVVTTGREPARVGTRIEVLPWATVSTGRVDLFGQ